VSATPKTAPDGHQSLSQRDAGAKTKYRHVALRLTLEKVAR
jgi:hypothetical protein